MASPGRGERVVGFGYHSSSWYVLIQKDGTRHININAFGAATVGEVKEVHHERRDSCRLSFPSYQVNARFDGGMIGGPVTSDRGRLCGIICLNLLPTEADQEHVSYAASLWPLMAIPINVTSEGRFCSQSYLLLELAKVGIIQAFDWEKVELVQNEGSYGVWM